MNGNGNHAGGRPPLPRFQVAVLVTVDVGAHDETEAEARVAHALGRVLATSMAKEPGRPVLHLGHASTPARLAPEL